MRAPRPDETLKAQLGQELCTILREYPRSDGAALVDTHPTELSRLRRADLRRFSLARIMRYIACAGYDIEVHLKRTPRREQRTAPHLPTSSVVRYDYYGRAV